MVQDRFHATSPSNDVSRKEVAARDRSLDSFRSSDQFQNRRARSCRLVTKDYNRTHAMMDGGRTVGRSGRKRELVNWRYV
jgi:hypothetical protein